MSSKREMEKISVGRWREGTVIVKKRGGKGQNGNGGERME